MTVDAQQVSLLTTSLNDAGTGYRIDDEEGAGHFIDQYSGYVTQTLMDGLGEDAEMPDGYPGPTAKFPSPTAAANTTYADIVEPAAISFEKDDIVNLVSFGLYVDYLSDDTLLAYKCALDEDDEDECAGLGGRAPLDVIPFYAVNVASLGDWTSPAPGVAGVAGAAGATQVCGRPARSGSSARASIRCLAMPFSTEARLTTPQVGRPWTTPARRPLASNRSRNRLCSTLSWASAMKRPTMKTPRLAPSTRATSPAKSPRISKKTLTASTHRGSAPVRL